MKISKNKLSEYCKAASSLAASLTRDIVEGKTISQDTVLSLNRFEVAADDAKVFIHWMKTGSPDERLN